MKSFTNISYFGVNTSELVIEKATYHDNRVFLLSQKKSPLLIIRSATVAAMAESVSTWSMRTPKTDSVGQAQVNAYPNKKQMQCHCKELPRPVDLMILNLKLQL